MLRLIGPNYPSYTEPPAIWTFGKRPDQLIINDYGKIDILTGNLTVIAYYILKSALGMKQIGFINPIFGSFRFDTDGKITTDYNKDNLEILQIINILNNRITKLTAFL